ncbi:MAG TPA: ABC transporter substrate-binding protein [Alphaproteobacteria bacterium]|jgi:phospholipid transport system substrate-binding protein
MTFVAKRRLFAALSAAALLAGAFALAPTPAHAQDAAPAQAAPAQAAQSDASKFVQELGDRAILELTDKKISDEERVNRMRAMLKQSFDEVAVARFVLGTYWNRATPDEQGEFTKLYETLVSYTYAGLFKKYSGETFQVLRERTVDGDTVVYAQINQPAGGQPIPIEMLVRNGDGGYRAVDIKVEGISMPLTHRKEYASVIQRNQGQVSGLIKILREKAAQLEKGGAAN